MIPVESDARTRLSASQDIDVPAAVDSVATGKYMRLERRFLRRR